jgi:high-affinity iron transporter
MASHGREMAREMEEVGAAVASGARSLTALAIVVGIAVLREGSEIVLFLYGIAASGGTSSMSMLLGGLVGIAGGALITALLYFGLLAIPTRRLFAVTSGLITLLAAGLAAQAVVYLQQAGYMRVLTRPLWNTGWLLDEHSLVGQLLHTLIGYSSRPNGMQLIVYLGTIAVIVGLMQMTTRGNLMQASGSATAAD